jgi:hypothetical protein
VLTTPTHAPGDDLSGALALFGNLLVAEHVAHNLSPTTQHLEEHRRLLREWHALPEDFRAATKRRSVEAA